MSEVLPGEARLLAEPGLDVLQMIAEGVTSVAGWGVAAVSVVHNGLVRVVAVSGPEDARETLLRTIVPVVDYVRELEHADDWGVLKFVPHDRMTMNPEQSWVPDIAISDDPDAWHPLDLLTAPLYDEDGSLRGVLGIDVPDDGRRPSVDQRRILEVYVGQAARAVRAALDRDELAEQVRLMESARTVVRGATRQPSLEAIISVSRNALVQGFRARGMWLHTFGLEIPREAVHANDGTEAVVPRHLARVARRGAQAVWRDQRVVVVARDRVVDEHLLREEHDEIVGLIESLGLSSMLFIPIGSGSECLGILALTRARKDPEWTEVEANAAIDIGHDLGAAIRNVRAFEREQRTVAELQKLDSYKSQLIATVSHELKNPLAAIVGHLEMLDTDPGLSQGARGSLAAMERGARRLGRVVDDLLLVAKVSDPETPLVARPVDLRPIVDDVVGLTEGMTQQRGQAIRMRTPDTPALALGDHEELERVVTNLVSNAVKYSPDGGRIDISLRRVDDEVELSCRDHGIGISEDDQLQLFTEFFRSSHTAVAAQAGTGLGLVIVRRIVARHHGRIEVVSELGKGSTFRVFLPAADLESEVPATSAQAGQAGQAEVSESPSAQERAATAHATSEA